jgi:DNA-binding SARP family transcriptional activator
MHSSARPARPKWKRGGSPLSRTIQSDIPALSVVTELPAKRRLSLLGAFTVTEGVQLVVIPSDAQRLVALLALSERPVSRVRVAALLWPDSTEARAAASLRSALWRLRRAAPWLILTGDNLEISEEVDVDVRSARALAHRMAEAPIGDEVSSPEPFLEDLLPDWYEDWAILERERFRQTRLHALEALCELLVGREDYARAVDAGLAAVAGEPLRESAHRTLIRAHLAEGNLGEAVRQYRSFQALLHQELGVEPSPELGLLVGILTS